MQLQAHNVDLDQNIIISRGDSINRRHKFKCPQCSELLIPVMGNGRAWHFRHKNPSSCSGGKGGEGDTHKQAKMILHEHLALGRTLNIKNTCELCNKTSDILKICTSPHDHVKVEGILPNGGRGDIVIYSSLGVISWCIEIMDTHKQQRENMSWVEIDASDVIENREVIENTVFIDRKRYRCSSCENNHITIKDMAALPGISEWMYPFISYQTKG